MIENKIENIALDKIIKSCIERVETTKFKGFDPYDALNSKFIRTLSFGNKYIQAGLTQFFRSFPINLRSLFFISKGYNPKGIGLFLESYSKLYFIEKDEKYLPMIDQLLDILNETKSEGYHGNCWGYNFPWQSRVVYKPRWTPTIVNTAFIGHALLYCYELTNSSKALDLVKGIPDFILKDLNRYEEDNSFCFSYSPIDKEFVHNANMLGASFLIRYAKIFNKPELNPVAHRSLKYSINHQNTDGSWYFANTSSHQWIDSFHTGFKLESIRWFIEAGEGDSYIKNYEKGIEFYVQNFFLKDGTPKYYHNITYPIDIHAPAEGIYFFSKFADSKFKTLTARIYTWVVNNMYSESKNYFYFRISKYGKNKIEYIRWSSSWILRGLVEFKYNLYLKSNGKN
jgi:hypothetical protein